MLSIPKTVKMDEEIKTKKINYNSLTGNAVEDSATTEELPIICGFAVIRQWTMKLVDHLH